MHWCTCCGDVRDFPSAHLLGLEEWRRTTAAKQTAISQNPTHVWACFHSTCEGGCPCRCMRIFHKNWDVVMNSCILADTLEDLSRVVHGCAMQSRSGVLPNADVHYSGKGSTLVGFQTFPSAHRRAAAGRLSRDLSPTTRNTSP